MEYALNILIERRDNLNYALEEYKNNVDKFDENISVVLENRRKYNSCIEAIKILTDNKNTSDANLNIGCVSKSVFYCSVNKTECYHELNGNCIYDGDCEHKTDC